MRIGVLGGTFDPPHVGHLLAASDACEGLALDQLLFVPAAQQPLKAGAITATPEQRVRMLELMVGVDPRYAVDRTEIERGGLSYTVETLAALSSSGHYPGATFFLLIGADLAAQLASWREPARIAALAEIVVLARGEAPAPPAPEGPRMAWLGTRRVDVSSTEIRARVRAGQPITGLVAELVARFIRDAGLYR